MVKITVASGKGGTGKTTLSLALAELLSERHSVTVVDLDVEEPDADLFVESEKEHEDVITAPIAVWNESSCTSCGLCAGVCAQHALIYLPGNVMIFEEMCKGCGHCVYHCPTDALQLGQKRIGVVSRFRTPHFSLFEGRLDVGVEQPVPMISATKRAVEQENADIIIFDAPPGSSCPSLEAVKDADMVLLVTEPSPFGLHDLQKVYETVISADRTPLIIVNRDNGNTADLEQWCAERNLSIIAKIPHSIEAAKQYAQGKSVLSVPEIRRACSIMAEEVERRIQ